MKKAILAAVFTSVFVFPTIAQEIALGNLEMYLSYMKGEYRNTAVPKLIHGSPYLDENFRLGTLSFKGREPITAPIRYNIVNEEFEVKVEDKIFYLQDEIEVRLEEGNFKKYYYKDSDNEMLLGYFKIFSKDPEEKKLILLEKYIKKIKAAQEVRPMKTPTPAKYLDRSEFYLKFPGTQFAVVAEGKTKKFIEAFPAEHQDKIKKFIKENKLKTGKQQDLQSIISYYNNIK